MSILDEIVDDKRAEVQAQAAALNLSVLKNRAAHQPVLRSLREALMAPGLSVIAEFKRRSPSAGVINDTADPGATAMAYEAAGAAAISVLTERAHFGGSTDDLERVRQAVGLPVLRKDFIFDEYQIYESRAVGADAILLIARILGRGDLGRLIKETSKAGLEALVEVHGEAELEDALAAGAEMIGVNNRDLETFDVDLSVVERLRPLVPDETPLVSESGCKSAADVARLREAGVDAVLIGGALMDANDIQDRMAELFGKE